MCKIVENSVEVVKNLPQKALNQVVLRGLKQNDVFFDTNIGFLKNSKLCKSNYRSQVRINMQIK